mmetsp:Transcript_9246/g.22249  ORF Transcript_9246/g.22249 Transcript_9246/m.22249 type:complete len:203 (-) Transcript_9246:7-615(-)
MRHAPEPLQWRFSHSITVQRSTQALRGPSHRTLQQRCARAHASPCAGYPAVPSPEPPRTHAAAAPCPGRSRPSVQSCCRGTAVQVRVFLQDPRALLRQSLVDSFAHELLVALRSYIKESLAPCALTVHEHPVDRDLKVPSGPGVLHLLHGDLLGEPLLQNLLSGHGMRPVASAPTPLNAYGPGQAAGRRAHHGEAQHGGRQT